MRGLVENLLDLARVDGGLTEKAVEVVDLSRLLSEALLPFEPVFFERGLPLESQIVEGIIVRGSELHLRQVVDILLDNARKYAQGPVEIRLDRSGSRWCLLFVASPGEEMSSQEIKDIFKRFYRRDKSRSQEGGAGLGLSIAQGIVEAHGGKIWAESRDSINIFYVRLPALHGRQ